LWAVSAFCPLLLGLLLGWALPQNVIDSKLPGPFIQQHEQVLANAHTLVASEPGMAYALAWSLRRSDIHLYNSRGELAYGLDYADAPVDKAISPSMLPQ